MNTEKDSWRNFIMESEPIEMAALGRPLYPGMLYNCCKDSFIPGVTLWDKASLYKDLDTHIRPRTDLKFSSSDTLSSKSSLMDISASLKASFMGGLVEVGGSAKYLHDTKSSNQQSRVTMNYTQTTRFDQLTMTQLSDITYPEVFEKKTATHVVTAVLYGAQAFMVFDQTFSEDENKQTIEGELNVMVKKIPTFSIEGKGSLELTVGEKKIAENISCTFYGDFLLAQNPTTYMEALQVYKELPKLLKDNPENVVPIKVWLYPLHMLNTQAARLMTEISTSLLFNTEAVMENLEKVERRCNDLFSRTQVNLSSDIKERLTSFQSSFNIYKLVFQKALRRVLPAIRGGGEKEQSLENILKIHTRSPFNASKLNTYLDNTKSELVLVTSYTRSLKGIAAVDANGLTTILCNPDIDVVVCLTLTSLKYEDPYLSSLYEFLQYDEFMEVDGKPTLHSITPRRIIEWFKDPEAIKNIRVNLSLFKSFADASKDDKKMCFVVSAISDSSSPGSSIYLYEQGTLTNRHFKPPVSKLPKPIVKSINENSVSLILQKSPTGETVQYRVEYKEEKTEKEEWIFINTSDEHVTLTRLKFGKEYLIRYRTVQ
ncbi:putative verrucotoxin subunit beta-like [Triplophysa rosa]|uniref:Verrucotoxin subunit beta-like n=1 Tax=Triplophysa rosa TaxID=992332 RepID=A0A9W7TJ81_TRIRA|nr:putative verrucotoxin subunit beta-like [Triplophysa rosa]